MESPSENWSDEHTNYNLKENLVLSRLSTSEAAVNYFIKEIMKRHIVPGDKLPSERLLQKKLQISRFSFRDSTYQGVQINKINFIF
jgi:DNA-binding transcriptional MocR family regulator